MRWTHHRGVRTDRIRLGATPRALVVTVERGAVAEAKGELVVRAYTPLSNDLLIGFVDLAIRVYRPALPRFPDGGRMTQLLDQLPIGGTTIEVARASESRERDDDAAARPGVVVSPSPHHHTSERATGNLAVVEQALSSLNTTNQPKETRGVGTTDDRHRPTRTTDPLRHNDANL